MRRPAFLRYGRHHCVVEGGNGGGFMVIFWFLWGVGVLLGVRFLLEIWRGV